MENPLAFWRDLAIVWLVLLTMIIVAVPGVILYLAQLYLRRFRRWLRMPLLNAQVWALRIRQGTQRTATRVANVPIGLYSMDTRLRVTARAMLRAVWGK